MIDYKKAEQAKKLLEESGVDYVFAYIDDNGKIIGNVQGTVLKAKYCAVAIMQAIGEQICDSHGDKAAVVSLHDVTMKRCNKFTMMTRRSDN